MTSVLIPEVNMLKNSSTFAVSVPINLSIILGFVSENSTKETYFVDALRTIDRKYVMTRARISMPYQNLKHACIHALSYD